MWYTYECDIHDVCKLYDTFNWRELIGKYLALSEVLWCITSTFNRYDLECDSAMCMLWRCITNNSASAIFDMMRL